MIQGVKSRAVAGKSVLGRLSWPLLLAVLALWGHPATAGCGDTKPKEWDTGDAIISPAPTTTSLPATTEPGAKASPAIIGVGGQTSLSVTALDNDHWVERCKKDNAVEKEGKAADDLRYYWSGNGTFSDRNSASPTWTAAVDGTPLAAQEYSLACRINDAWADEDPKPSGVGDPETGNRNDTAISVTVQVKSLKWN